MTDLADHSSDGLLNMKMGVSPGKNGQKTKYIFMCLLWNIVINNDVKIDNIKRCSGKD
jgi:hypothetical protein